MTRAPIRVPFTPVFTESARHWRWGKPYSRAKADWCGDRRLIGLAFCGNCGTARRLVARRGKRVYVYAVLSDAHWTRDAYGFLTPALRGEWCETKPRCLDAICRYLGVLGTPEVRR